MVLRRREEKTLPVRWRYRSSRPLRRRSHARPCPSKKGLEMHGYAAGAPSRFDTRASIFFRPADSPPTLGAQCAKEMRCHLRSVNHQRKGDFARTQPPLSCTDTPRRTGRQDTSSHTPTYSATFLPVTRLAVPTGQRTETRLRLARRRTVHIYTRAYRPLWLRLHPLTHSPAKHIYKRRARSKRGMDKTRGIREGPRMNGTARSAQWTAAVDVGANSCTSTDN